MGASCYFSWQFAREHGFWSYISYGDFVSLGKGIVWPYFALRSENTSDEAVKRGKAAANKEDWDSAITEYTKAIRLDPECAEAYWCRGMAQLRKHEHDGAIADCTEAIRLDPKHAEAYCWRGAAYGEKREWNKAIADLSEAIRLNPEYFAGYFHRGCVYVGKGYPSDGGLVGAFVWGYQGRGKDDFNKAIADFTEAIRLKPDCAEAYYCRGIAYAGKGENDKAEADYAEAKRLGYKPQ
jgi:tetratricopeptide (TPR) repeat protein